MSASPIPIKFVVSTSGQLGPVLKHLRKRLGLTQTALGKKIGLSQERISAIENHPERVTFDMLITVMMALEAHFTVELRGQPPVNNCKR